MSTWYGRPSPSRGRGPLHVLAVDLGAAGRSQEATSRTGTTWLSALIHETCDGPPALIGLSLGGSIALRYAADHSDDLVLLVPVSSGSLAGEAVFGHGVAERVLHHFTSGRLAPEPFPDLTDRERQVLELLAQGLPNRHIASRLFVSDKTVRNNVSNILTKLQVTDRGQAIVAAREAGLAPPDSDRTPGERTRPRPES